jgi:hypothetical protein
MDVVVVYEVDRLTRSLADFAKIGRFWVVQSNGRSGRPRVDLLLQPCGRVLISMSRHRRPGSLAAFSPKQLRNRTTCARAERNTRTASNDAEIRPSLVRLGAQNGPQKWPFSAVPRRFPRQPDSLAERSEFELPVPLSKLLGDSVVL